MVMILCNEKLLKNIIEEQMLMTVIHADDDIMFVKKSQETGHKDYFLPVCFIYIYLTSTKFAKNIAICLAITTVYK